MDAGDIVSGWAAFDARDYSPFDDDAVVVMVNSGTETIWQKSVADVGDYGETDWQYWEWTAPADGFYTLQLGCRNILDDGFNSVGLFDGISIQ